MAVCLFAIPSRESRNGVSRSAVHDCGYRYASRSDSCQENDGPHAGRSPKWLECYSPDFVAHRDQSWAWCGQTRDETDRRVYGYLFVSVLAAWSERAVIGTQYSVLGT